MAIPFLFYCKYEKREDGYQIRYFTSLSVFGFLRLLLCFAVIGWIVYQQRLNLYAAYGILGLLCCINHFVQRSHCIKQFEAEYQK